MGNCDGKAITFKQLREIEEKKSAPKAEEATAKISPPTVSDSDSEEERMNSILQTMTQNNCEDFGYNYANNIAGFSILGVVTEDNIPSYELLKEKGPAYDNNCIICPEEDMDLEGLTDHYLNDHTIIFTEEYEDDLETFQDKAIQFPGYTRTIKTHENGSSSEEQEGYRTSEIDEYYGWNKVESAPDSSSSIKSSRSKRSAQKTGSSSDSSSSTSSSRSNGKKKSKSKASRDHESLRLQFNSQRTLFENKFKEMDSSLRTMSEINEKILANQVKEEEVKTTNKHNFKELKSSLTQLNKVNEEILAKQKEIKGNNDHSAEIKTIKDTLAKKQDHSIEIKAIKDTLATNDMKTKNKEKSDKRKEFRTLKYLGAVDSRLSSLENGQQKNQEGQEPLKIGNPPNQIITKAIEDPIAVQKSQVKNNELVKNSQSEKVSEASTSQTSENQNTIHPDRKSNKRSIKVSHLKEQRYKSKMLRIKERKVQQKKKEEVPQNFMSHLFNLFNSCFKGIFSLLNNIFTSKYGTTWGILFILFTMALKIQAADIHGSNISQLASNDQSLNLTSNEQLQFFPIDHMEANTIITHLGESENRELFEINSACDAIKTQNKICLAHQESCEVNKKSIVNLENSIKIHSNNLHQLNKVCESTLINPTTIIKNCNDKLKKNVINQKKLFPGIKRFTNISFESSLKTLSLAITSKKGLESLVSTSNIENHSNLHHLMKKAIFKLQENVSTADIEELINLSLDNTISTTTYHTISGSSRACGNTLLIKTFISPMVKLQSMKKVNLTDGKLMIAMNNHQNYVLLPYKHMDIKKQSGQTTKIIGRNCVINNSIEAKSTYSHESFAEIIKFNTSTTMTLNMSCSSYENSNITTWTIKAGSHELKLPIDCSIISTRLNCSSVTFKSTMTGAGTQGKNSTSHFNLANAELKSTISTRSVSTSGKTHNFHQSNKALMNKVIWPIIGLILAGLILVSIGWVCAITKSQGGNLSNLMPLKRNVNKQKNEFPRNNPSSPIEMEIMDLPTYTTSEVMGILDSPNDTYTAMEAETIVARMERMINIEAKGIYPTSELMDLLDSPMDIYTAMETEDITNHIGSMLDLENGHTFQSQA